MLFVVRSTSSKNDVPSLASLHWIVLMGTPTQSAIYSNVGRLPGSSASNSARRILGARFRAEGPWVGSGGARDVTLGAVFPGPFRQLALYLGNAKPKKRGDQLSRFLIKIKKTSQGGPND